MNSPILVSGGKFKAFMEWEFPILYYLIEEGHIDNDFSFCHTQIINIASDFD